MRFIKIISLSLILCMPLVANASTITVFSAVIDGSQANAGLGTGSGGLGSATMTLDHDTAVFSWFVAWQDLPTTVVASHFHGPAPPGANAGVQVGFDHTSNPSIGMAVLTPVQVSDLLAGLWYINIHTMDFPGGEIRGQVLPISAIPIPAAIWLFGAAIAGLGGFARRRN